MNTKFFLQKQFFGVCQRLGEAMGIDPVVVRFHFLYASFLTLGSPVLMYLFIAFWMKFKTFLRPHRTGAWDL
jgi:phage shock protein C